jgi:glycosyltransferase involved in cell wall biosynthesis
LHRRAPPAETNVQKLTVLIPAHNEARNIAACIESVAWADEVLVIDDCSNDPTAEMARAAGARVMLHEFSSPSSQKGYALQNAAHPWVLSLDADERVTAGLRDEIRGILAADGPADGYFIPIHGFFLGQRIRFGAWRGERKLRLFRRDLTHFPERAIHESAEVRGRIGLCRSPILHYSYRSLDDCFVKARRYAEWGAVEWRRRGRRPSTLRMLLRGPASFARDYILKAGFLDGRRGLILALFDAWQVAAREAKLWELGSGHAPAYASEIEHAEDQRHPADV